MAMLGAPRARAAAGGGADTDSWVVSESESGRGGERFTVGSHWRHIGLRLTPGSKLTRDSPVVLPGSALRVVAERGDLVQVRCVDGAAGAAGVTGWTRWRYLTQLRRLHAVFPESRPGKLRRLTAGTTDTGLPRFDRRDAGPAAAEGGAVNSDADYEDASSSSDPSDGTASVLSTAAADWVEVLDTTTNKYYYRNNVTEEVSWTKPAAVREAARRLAGDGKAHNPAGRDPVAAEPDARPVAEDRVARQGLVNYRLVDLTLAAGTLVVLIEQGARNPGYRARAFLTRSLSVWDDWAYYSFTLGGPEQSSISAESVFCPGPAHIDSFFRFPHGEPEGPWGLYGSDKPGEPTVEYAGDRPVYAELTEFDVDGISIHHGYLSSIEALGGVEAIPFASAAAVRLLRPHRTGSGVSIVKNAKTGRPAGVFPPLRVVANPKCEVGGTVDEPWSAPYARGLADYVAQLRARGIQVPQQSPAEGTRGDGYKRDQAWMVIGSYVMGRGGVPVPRVVSFSRFVDKGAHAETQPRREVADALLAEAWRWVHNPRNVAPAVTNWLRRLPMVAFEMQRDILRRALRATWWFPT
eukprot:gene12999-16208_t